MRILLISRAGDPIFRLRGAAQRQKEKISLLAYTADQVDQSHEIMENMIREVKTCDFVMVQMHGTLADFTSWDRLREASKGKPRYVHTLVENEGMENSQKINEADLHRLRLYCSYLSENNLDAILLCAQSIAENKMTVLPIPERSRLMGIFYNGIVEEEEAYLRKVDQSGKSVVGILINDDSAHENDMRHAAALIRKIEKQDAVPLAVFARMEADDERHYAGVSQAFAQYFLKDGSARLDVLINLVPFSINHLCGNSTEGKNVLEMLDVPVIQAMTTMYSPKELETAPAGIQAYALSYAVYDPEFDGQIIGFPLAYKGKVVEEGVKRDAALPIEERIGKMVRLACKWADLHRLPMKEKRFAIVFHQHGDEGEGVGEASGLDGLESVCRLLRRLKQLGFVLDHEYADGRQILNEMMQSIASVQQGIRKDDTPAVKKSEYERWFQDLPQKIQDRMLRRWGSPDADFIHGQMNLNGIVNGNLFIGIQPWHDGEYGCSMDDDGCCNHPYMAFYRWIERKFNANAVIHMGTHGSLEGLAGRSVGLGENCFPDAVLGAMPNLYPFVINDPGEGALAKRRGCAVLISHMIPGRVDSGVYDELEVLDADLNAYDHYRLADPARAEEIFHRLYQNATKLHLCEDGLSDQEHAAAWVKQLHHRINRIRSRPIAYGLHVLGCAPEGEGLKGLLRAFVRVGHGSVYSLREGIAAAMGMEISQMDEGNLPNLVDERGIDLFDLWEKRNYSLESVDTVIEETLGTVTGDGQKLRDCLECVSTVILPKLRQSHREMDALCAGLEGRRVPEGPSGCPTNGNMELIPAGKNFYLVDPKAIPSRDAWETGRKLGQALLQKHLETQGKYPESIAILVFAIECMRTMGDDIAEIMWLMGLEPIWSDDTGKMIDLRVVPLCELQRPRIDVTLRITGLFRDSFPMLIERIEDAVNHIAALNEPHEMNFIRKHVDEDIREMMKAGKEAKEAEELARLRIFGCAPGRCTSGIREYVQSHRWTDRNQLAQVYTDCSSHVYGAKYQGVQMSELFAHRLSQAELSVKNESAAENDLFEGDELYGFYGGLTAAVDFHGGRHRPAYLPNSADRRHTELKSLNEEAVMAFYARVNNPLWLEGLKAHGYRGGLEVAAMMDSVMGWGAATDAVESWMFQGIADRLMFNEENRSWLEKENIHALHHIAGRLLEAAQRYMWEAEEDCLEELQNIYMMAEGDLEDAQDSIPFRME